MSEKSLLDQWRDMAYDRNLSKNELETFWSRYFTIEKKIYEQLLDECDVAHITKRNCKGTRREIWSGRDDDGRIPGWN